MENIIKKISISIYIFINLIFIAKYSYEVTDYNYLLATGYAILLPGLFYFAKYIPEQFFTRKLFFALVFLFIVFWVIILARVSPESINVDRYEMIRLFWDNFFAGKNPYTPRSVGTNIPGPFPFYFYLAFPFNVINEIGYFALLGFIIFSFLLRKYVKVERNRIIILLALLFSPAYSWEIICRSTLFVNSVLILLYLFVLSNIRLEKNREVIVSALFLGFLLSTRSIALVVLLPFLLFLGIPRAGFKRISLWVIGAVSGFTATFLPVICFQGFYPYNNPIAVQSIFLPTWIPVLVLLLMSYLSMRYFTTYYLFIFGSAIALFSLTFLYIIIQIYEYNYLLVLFHDHADISYLILSLPFVLFGMLDAHALHPSTYRYAVDLNCIRRSEDAEQSHKH